MKKRFSKDQWQAIETSLKAEDMCYPGDGLTIHLDHTDCPAGEDRRGRLYLTRTGNLILGHCFNCGYGGAKKLSNLSPYNTLGAKLAKFSTLKGLYNIPGVGNEKVSWGLVVNYYNNALLSIEITPDEQTWPDKFFFGVPRASLKEKEPQNYGIRIDRTFRFVWIPIYGGDTGEELVGFQVRDSDPDTKQKWTKLFRDRDPPKSVLYNSSGRTDVVYIVEDVISAMRIDLAGYPALCLMGTSLDDTTALMVANVFSSAGVWLDNDSDIIKKKSLEMAATLNLYGIYTEECVPGEGIEPKHMDHDRLESFLSYKKGALGDKVNET